MLLVVATTFAVSLGESDPKELRRLRPCQFTRRHQFSQSRSGFRSGIGTLCLWGGLLWFFLFNLGFGLFFYFSMNELHILSQLSRFRSVSYTHLTLPTKA